jgi:tetratricopeptide (TPR) repeat protein
VAADESHAQAASELGYALRRTGRFEQAIGWYDHALRVNPDLLEAVEYRGEAYLEIGELEGAKAAYMELFRGNPDLAGQLLAAMEAWVAKTVDPDPGFSDWVVERRALAKLTGSGESGGPAAW